MKFKKVIYASFILSIAPSVMAYKACSDYQIMHVFSDTNHVYIGRSASDLDGVITNTKANYEAMVSIVLAARTSKDKMIVRYKDDSVNCDNPAWNSEIIGIGF